jgi:predicted transcriptional regulator
MLEKLFGSRTRVKLMKLFLLSPDRRLTLVEIVKLLKLQLVAVKKELDNLEEFGMVEHVLAEEAEGEDKGGQRQEKKFYRLDPNFVLKDELKALIVKSQILYERDFLDRLMKLGRIKLLVLTGIFVNLPDSPIDILVVGKINKAKLVALLAQLEQELGREVNFTFMEPGEFTFRLGMTDVFLYNILEGKRLILIDEFGV